MPRPSKREDLVEAATRVFCRDGFRATNVDRVIEEAGVSRMTLYNHFPSKDDLVVAALRRRDETSRAEIHRAMEEATPGSPVDRILAIFRLYRDWMAGDGFRGCAFTTACVEYGDPTCLVRRTAAEHKREIIRLIEAELVDAGLRRADAAPLALQLHCLLDGAVVARVAGVDEKAPAAAAEAALAAAKTLLSRTVSRAASR